MERMVISPPDFVYDKRKDGWTLLADAPSNGTFTLELVELLRDGEQCVGGEVMLERAKELGKMAGQRHAKQILTMANQIPESWRAFILVFPGTVWQDAIGRQIVLYLRWHLGAWLPFWEWLGYGWSRNTRLVRLGSP